MSFTKFVLQIAAPLPGAPVGLWLLTISHRGGLASVVIICATLMGVCILLLGKCSKELRAGPFWLILLFALARLSSGCGSGSGYGGGGGGGGSTPVNGGTASITEPATGSNTAAAVVSGVPGARSTVTVQAIVTSDNGAGVNWFVNGQLGGSSALGVISADTAASGFATYTAPNSLPSAPPNNSVTISAQQPGKDGGGAGPMSNPTLTVVIFPATNALPTGGGSLSFVFRLRGFSRTGPGLPFGIVGRFTMDGVGSADASSGITAGLEDVNIAQPDGSSAAFTKVAFTGGYNMDSSSHGTIKLNVTSPPWAGSPPPNPPPSTMTFTFTLSEDGSITDMIEAEPDGSFAGTCEFESQNATTNAVASFTLLMEGTGDTGGSAFHKGVVGRFDLTAATSTTGTIANTSTTDDESGNGGPAQTLGGTYTMDDTVNGHGEFDLVAGASNPVLTYYIVNPRKLFVLETDPNPVASHKAILVGALVEVAKQAGVPVQFDNSSLKGPLIFQMQGITDSLAVNGQGHASPALGIFSGTPGTATGAGTLSGIMDFNDGGFVPPDAPLSFQGATFAIDNRGRGIMHIAVSVSGSPVTYNFVFYSNTIGSGVMVEQQASDGSNRGRSGIWKPQSATPPFVASGANGTFVGTTTTRIATALSINSAAVFTINGGVSGNSGTFIGNADGSVAGIIPASTAVSGTFTVTDQSNGRGTITATSGSIVGAAHAAFYVTFQGEIIVIGTDSADTEPQIIYFDQ